jgi:hypothetical protein
MRLELWSGQTQNAIAASDGENTKVTDVRGREKNNKSRREAREGLSCGRVAGGQRDLILGIILAALAPTRAMLDDPIRQGPFKPDIVPGLFGFNPLVLQDFFPLGLELPVKGGLYHQVSLVGYVLSIARHKEPVSTSD